LVERVVVAQEFGDLDSEFPADHQFSAWEILLECPAIPKRDFPSELGAVGDQGIMGFDHTGPLKKKSYRPGGL